jgi:hypothetical protein
MVNKNSHIKNDVLDMTIFILYVNYSKLKVYKRLSSGCRYLHHQEN